MAYALESIKGKPFETLMQESILRPLGLNHTYYVNAPVREGVIPVDPEESGWNFQLGDENPYVFSHHSPYSLTNLQQLTPE